MKSEEQLNRKVDAAMNSLDGLTAASANPFLYGKIQHRMADLRSLSQRETKWLIRFACMLLVLVAANLYTYTAFSKSYNSASGAKTGIESFANEYGLNSTGDNI